LTSEGSCVLRSLGFGPVARRVFFSRRRSSGPGGARCSGRL